MISKKLLLAFVSAALPKALAYDRAGRDWRYLDDFIDSSVKQKNATEAKRLRAEETFWNVVPGAAKNFPTEWETGSDENVCGVAFYFPAMKERAASKKAKSTLEQTWGVPFAVTPFYGKNVVVPALNREFPAYVPEGSNNSSVVFHQMSGNQGFKDDLYVLFTNSTEDRVNPKQRLADFKVALVGVAGTLYNRGEILVAMEWNDMNVGEWTLNFRDMVEAYVNHHHSGMVPNPWTLGIGSSAWPEFTGINTFWGYDNQGKYITGYPVGD